MNMKPRLVAKDYQQAMPQTRLLCTLDDLVPYSGVCALLDGQQIAVFYLPDTTPAIYALSNWDPIGKANVLSRGMLGDLKGELVVASPLYKQHFSLRHGGCIEDDSISVATFKVVVKDQMVFCELEL